MSSSEDVDESLLEELKLCEKLSDAVIDFLIENYKNEITSELQMIFNEKFENYSDQLLFIKERYDVRGDVVASFCERDWPPEINTSEIDAVFQRYIVNYLAFIELIYSSREDDITEWN